MQDEDPIVEEQVPPAADVALTPDPQPEPVIEASVDEPVPELAPTPIEPESIPEPIPAPETPPQVPVPEIVIEPVPTSPVAPEVPPAVSAPPEPPAPDPVAVEPVKAVDPTTNSEPPKPSPVPSKEDPAIASPPTPAPEPPKGQGGIPQKVLDLTPAELDAARRLWATQNIKSVQAKSAHDRTARKLSVEAEIVKYVKAHAPATLSMIAYNLNISPRKASDYMRDLVKSGKIKATGQTTSRRYS